MFNIPIDNVYSLVYYYFIKTYILHNKERRNILQPLLTNVKEYSLEDIANLLPIGVQQVRRYVKSKELKATIKRNRYRVAEEDLKAFMIEKGFTNLNL